MEKECTILVSGTRGWEGRANLSQCEFQSTLCIFRRKYMLIPQIHRWGAYGVSVLKKTNMHMNDARVHRLTVMVGCVCMCLWRWTGGDVGKGDGIQQASWSDCTTFPRKERCSSARRGRKGTNEAEKKWKGLLPLLHPDSQGDTLEPTARFCRVYMVPKPNIRSVLLAVDKVVSSSQLLLSDLTCQIPDYLQPVYQPLLCNSWPVLKYNINKPQNVPLSCTALFCFFNDYTRLPFLCPSYGNRASFSPVIKSFRASNWSFLCIQLHWAQDLFIFSGYLNVF